MENKIENMSLGVLMENAKAEMITATNSISKKYNLNYYMLYLIYKDLYHNVEVQKEEELKNDILQQTEELNEEE